MCFRVCVLNRECFSLLDVPCLQIRRQPQLVLYIRPY